MSPQSAPLFGRGVFPELDLPESDLPESDFPESDEPPLGSSDVTVAELKVAMWGEHHARPAPDDHRCTCGRIREACVRDEVRAFWHAMSDESPPRPPKAFGGS